MNRDLRTANSQILGQGLRIHQTTLARKLTGQGHPQHLVRTERLGRNHGGQRTVDSSAQPEHDLPKATFVQIIFRSQNERPKHLLLLPFPDRLLRLALQVHHLDVFREGQTHRQEPSLTIDRHALAVKNQLVISAYLIDLNNRNLLPLRYLRQKPIPHPLLAQVPGRGGEVDQ